ncbi:hypothetical protein ACLOJK_041706 [Asimina triloba]
MIKKDVPTATYFVRAYVVDDSGKEGAYGQNSVKNKATNLFSVQGISGRHASLDIAAACFSAFAVVSLFGFFYEEKRKAKKSQGSFRLTGPSGMHGKLLKKEEAMGDYITKVKQLQEEAAANA